jgi:type II secretory pathway pseudopilin PulG
MKIISNQNGFTYILALTIVMIMGVMLGMVGQSWKTIKQRDKEKELLFRGSQIKEAIENWYNPKFKPAQMPHNRTVGPLMDLRDLLKDGKMPMAFRYIPQNYAAEVNDSNPKCAPNCAKLKIYQDPMTGKEWTIIRGTKGADGNFVASAGTQGGGIIGVASKSDEIPIRTDFKDTALENIASLIAIPTSAVAGSVSQAPIATTSPGGAVTPDATEKGGKITKYSQWQFIAESPQKNDHAKIYRAYHEGW